MDDERSTVFGKDVFKKAIKEDISVYFLERFAVVPWGRANETVDRPLISPVKEMTPKIILQTTKCFDTRHNICHRDPFAEILQQSIAK